MNLTMPKNYSLEQTGITQSLFSYYMQCPKKFLLAVNGYKQPESTAMIFGTFFHAALESHYAGGKPFDIINKYLFPVHVEKNYAEYMRVCGQVLMERYIKRYKKEVISPEMKFETNLTTNSFTVKLRGKKDGAFKRGKDTFLLETKTKSNISEEGLQNQLVLDWQSLFYVLAHYLEHNVLPVGVVYNVIRFPQRKPKDLGVFAIELGKEIDSKPDYYFMRWETQYTAEDIEHFKNELICKLWELKDRVVFYRNECSCGMYGGCPYLDFCATGSTRGLRKSKVLFEELV